MAAKEDQVSRLQPKLHTIVEEPYEGNGACMMPDKEFRKREAQHQSMNYPSQLSMQEKPAKSQMSAQIENTQRMIRQYQDLLN